jgi:hypothetical protein
VGVGLVLVVGALATVGGLLAGGRPRHGRRFRAVRLLVAAFVLQAGAGATLGAGPAYAATLALSGLLAAVFVAANARVPGVPLIGLGLALNAWVVGVNGAMPVSPSAAQTAGVAVDRVDPRHTVLADDSRLGLLGDVIPVPLPLRPEVVSAGDVLVAAGVGLVLLTGLRFGPARAQQRRAASARPGRRLVGP